MLLKTEPLITKIWKALIILCLLKRLGWEAPVNKRFPLDAEKGKHPYLKTTI